MQIKNHKNGLIKHTSAKVGFRNLTVRIMTVALTLVLLGSLSSGVVHADSDTTPPPAPGGVYFTQFGVSKGCIGLTNDPYTPIVAHWDTAGQAAPDFDHYEYNLGETEDISTGTNNFSDDIIINDLIGLDGEYNIAVYSVDTSGNRSEPATCASSLAIDTVPPVVNAGEDLPDVVAPINLNGLASDDYAVTTQWTQVDGPGIVSFNDSSSLQPLTSANANGTYTLRLTATDAAGNQNYDVYVEWD